MKVNVKWVALLDEDQDDFLIVEQGFKIWATELELRWFKNFTQFEFTLLTEHTPPALIILNGIAPAGTEFEWVKQFRANPSPTRTPIIILVEDYWEEQKQLYKQLDICDYVVKPAGQGELHKLIDKVRSLV